MTPPNDTLVKLRFDLPPGEWGKVTCEWLWGEPVGGHHYRLRDTPFCAYGYAFLDVVVAEPDEDGALVVKAAAKRSGHSTYRVFVATPKRQSAIEDYQQQLIALGCSIERAWTRLFAIDVPAASDVYAVQEILGRGQSEGVWQFEEAFMGHRFS